MDKSDTIVADGITHYTTDGRSVTPNPVQAWILDAAFSQSIDELFVFGGFGSGKTQALAWTLWKAMMLAYEFWDGKRLTRARFAIVSSDGSQLRTVTMPTFEAVFNYATGHDGPFWSIYGAKRNPLVESYSREDKLYELPWCTLTQATGHNGCQSIEGGSYLGIFCDETPLWLPSGFERVRHRYRQTGFPFRALVHFATPQPGRSLAAINERYQDCDPYKVYVEKGTWKDPYSYGRARIMMPTRLNAANLPPGYIQQLASGTSPQMAKAILDGELVLLEGRVYPTYDESSRIDYEYSPDRPVVLGYDPGFHRPYALAIQEIESGSDRWCAFDEIAIADVTRDTFADHLCRRHWIRNLSAVIHDPAAKQRETSGISDRVHLQNFLADRGVNPKFWNPYRPEHRLITYGCERGRAWLCSADGDRRFFVAHSLVGKRYGTGSDGHPVSGIHAALENQTIKTGTDEPDRSAKVDHLSHPSDAFRYLAVRYHPVAQVVDGGWSEVAEAGATAEGLGESMGDFGADAMGGWAERGY